MGRGSGVRAASKNSIEVGFYYRGVRCRERIKLPPTKANMNYVRGLKAEIERKIAIDDFNYADYFPTSKRVLLFATVPGAAIKTGDYLKKWLLENREYLKASTVKGYEKIIYNQLIPAFGEIFLSQLTRVHVREWGKAKDITAKTLGNLVSPLRAALDDAVEDGLIEANPLGGWRIRKRFKGRSTKPDIDPFSLKERAAILEVMTGQGHNLIAFAFQTGMRPSELCALDWPDIDFVHGYVYVTRAFTQAATEPEEPKTEAGTRRVKLSPQALVILTDQKTHTFLQGAEVFQNPRTGERWAGDQPIRKTLWVHALKRAGVRYRRPYQTRHTYASMMLMSGEDPRFIAAQLGHTDWTFTARVYARWIHDDAGSVGEKFAEWQELASNECK